MPYMRHMNNYRVLRNKNQLSDYIIHIIHSGRLAGYELCGLYRALRKYCLGIRRVLNLYDLIDTGKYYFMLSYDSTAPDGRYAQFIFHPGCPDIGTVCIFYRLFMASFMESAIARAVPEGASTFLLWCFQQSRYQSLNRQNLRGRFTSFMIRLMPMDIFADRRIGTDLDASSISFWSSFEKPVVQMTAPIPFFTA